MAGAAVSGQCVMPCAGDSTEMCGGPDAINWYYNSAIVPATVTLPAGWSTYGVVAEGNAGRALTYTLWSSSTNTVESCANGCASLGYTVAGTEYSQECYCGMFTCSALIRSGLIRWLSQVTDSATAVVRSRTQALPSCLALVTSPRCAGESNMSSASSFGLISRAVVRASSVSSVCPRRSLSSREQQGCADRLVLFSWIPLDFFLYHIRSLCSLCSSLVLSRVP